MKRPWALPLQPLYRTGLLAKNALYKSGLLPVRSLQRPVISIGSLSAGGAGKTPFVLALAQLLEREGISVDVLSRGYGRRSKAVEWVDPSGDAGHFGDEPLDLARQGVPVFVGASRFAAGTLAERSGSAELHLLDDGFQHRRLARALDIVLLTLEDTGDHLIPAGNLREPLSSLRRARVIVLRSAEADALRPLLTHLPLAEIWQIDRALQLPQSFPVKPVVFCAIARPAGFVSMLEAAGVSPVQVVARPDHHAWNRSDLLHLIAALRHTGADGFMTTAKDAVKLAPSARAMLEQTAPLVVAQLNVSLLDPAEALRTIRRDSGSRGTIAPDRSRA